MGENEIREILNNSKNYKKTHKKKYKIQASIPPIGIEIFNRLENATYKTSEVERVVMTGTCGEQWVSSVYELAANYTFEDGLAISPYELTQRMVKVMRGNTFIDVVKPFNIVAITGVKYYALHIPVQYQFKIQTQYGHILSVNAPGISHGSGDFIVCSQDKYRRDMPNLEDQRVVNGEVFLATYDLHAFPGFKSTVQTKSTTGHPHPEFDFDNISKDDKGKNASKSDMQNLILNKFEGFTTAVDNDFKRRITRPNVKVSSEFVTESGVFIPEAIAKYTIYIESIKYADKYGEITVYLYRDGTLVSDVTWAGDSLDQKTITQKSLDMRGMLELMTNGYKVLVDAGMYDDSKQFSNRNI